MTTRLIYTGGGFIPDVPARDLTEEDIKELQLDEAALINSGLYARAGESAAVADELKQRLKDIEEIDTPNKKRAKAGK